MLILRSLQPLRSQRPRRYHAAEGRWPAVDWRDWRSAADWRSTAVLRSAANWRSAADWRSVAEGRRACAPSSTWRIVVSGPPRFGKTVG
jgi:hypothetical protein